jgi:hypothetical protein
MTEPGPSRAADVIILYIRGQGNGQKGTGVVLSAKKKFTNVWSAVNVVKV